MRTAPPGPSVELPMGPRRVRGACQWMAGPHANFATGLWDHETCEGCADMGRAVACQLTTDAL
eukprot:4884962-Pyramimonas_sp.AAC.1